MVSDNKKKLTRNEFDDLIKQLKSNNIDYESFEVLDNTDPETKKIVEELEKINNELLDYDDMNIYI